MVNYAEDCALALSVLSATTSGPFERDVGSFHTTQVRLFGTSVASMERT